jgi:hypothetical protein
MSFLQLNVLRQTVSPKMRYHRRQHGRMPVAAGRRKLQRIVSAACGHKKTRCVERVADR